MCAATGVYALVGGRNRAFVLKSCHKKPQEKASKGGNEYENNDDVNDANVYVKKCDPVFNSFVACLSTHLPGKYLGFFC